MTLNEKFAEAQQLLAASGWSVGSMQVNGKRIHTVFDSEQTPRRSFIPVSRLYDYARGVFDAQDFNNVS